MCINFLCLETLHLLFNKSMFFFEKVGNLDAAGSIYWRAKKTLLDPSAFIEGHQRLQTKEGN